MKKIIILLSLSVIIISCEYVGNKARESFNEWNERIKKESEERKRKEKEDFLKRTIDFYVTDDKYKLKPNTKHPKHKELLQEYKKQKHRFSINLCSWTYNEKSFFMGDSPEKVIEVLGEPEEKEEKIYYWYGDKNQQWISSIDVDKKNTLKNPKKSRILVGINGKVTEKTVIEKLYFGEKKIYLKYKKFNIKISFENRNNKYQLSRFSIDMGNDLGSNGWKYDNNFDLVLLYDVPYRLGMNFNDFKTLTTEDKFDKRELTSFLQKECPVREGYRIYRHIETHFFHEIKGGGHLTFKGDYQPNLSAPIEYISFYELDNEYYKKKWGRYYGIKNSDIEENKNIDETVYYLD